MNQFTPIPAHELFRDFDAYRQFMIHQELTLEDDGSIVFKYEMPQTTMQKLMGRATEVTLTVYPLTMAAFEAAFREWQGTHDFHDEKWGSAAWKRKVSIRQAFDAACFLNPDLYAALLPKMTKREAALTSAVMKMMRDRNDGR